MIDDHELRDLEIDLTRAPLRAQFGATRSLRRVGKILNAGMRRDASGHMGNYFGIPGTEFEVPLAKHVSDELIGLFELEVGIEAKGAGLLGHIIVEGSVNNPPVYDHTAVLRRHREDIDKVFADELEEDTLGGEK